MNNEINSTFVDKLFKKGQSELKTSFFSFKFSPDYLSAVNYFVDAAKGYKQLKMFKESIVAFEEAIKCNKKLLESWQEAVNYSEIADIYLFHLNDFNLGFNALKNSSLSYKLSGKFTSGIKIYLDFANRLKETKNNFVAAEQILMEAYEDCKEHTHDELIRISLEETFTNLFDLLCQNDRMEKAIELIENYIKIQKSLKDEKKYKISKNFVKLGMLRIIINEAYMAENLIEEMYAFYSSDCSDDIDDLKKLIKAFKEGNKKDFTFLNTYAFSLFSNNLLKALKKKFDQKIDQLNINVIQNNQGNARIINSNISGEVESNYTEDTKATSEICNEIEVVNNPSDEYL
jgi:hypothetical protein